MKSDSVYIVTTIFFIFILYKFRLFDFLVGFDNFVIKIGTKEVEFVAFTDTYLKILTLFLIPHLNLVSSV